jgi:transposase-like protein
MEVKNMRLPKEKAPTGRAPRYSVEYYLMMAKQVVDEGLTYRKAAEIYNCSHGTVNHWVKQYRTGVLPGKVRKVKMDASARERNINQLTHQVKNLKTEIGELYLENLMLKKALEYSQQIKREDSSVITSENLDQFQEAAE